MKGTVLYKMKGTDMNRIFFIDEKDGPLYERLYQAIKEDVFDNRLKADEKMPSVRVLSKTMGISRTTVETAYSQLVAEGYLYSLPQKGYFVKPIRKLKKAEVYNLEDNSPDNTDIGARYDFATEYVELDRFDISLWKKSINRILTNQGQKLFRYSKSLGENELKQAISEYFGRVRAIKADWNQIVIGAGTYQLLNQLANFMKDRAYQDFCIESPGFVEAAQAFEVNGYNIDGIDLLNQRLDASKLKDYKKTILFTSPSYQFPYGTILPVDLRHELLDWAVKSDSYIIEDDYNNELTYLGKPISSLQGMDLHDRVLYLGSFSTLLIPSIRISFMVLPKHLIGDFTAWNGQRVQSASKLEQLALADFITQGSFGKHIRKIRKYYKEKNHRLKALTDEYLSDLADVHIPQAGLTCVISLKKTIASEDLNDLSYELNVNIWGISAFMIKNTGKSLEKKLVLNYRGINQIDMKQGIIALKELICRIC